MRLGECKIFMENEHYQGTREYQEDYFAFILPGEDHQKECVGLVLADGMGGLSGGETTSVLTVEKFQRGILEKRSLEECAREAHEAVCSFGAATEHTGSTVTAMCLRADHTLSWLSIGDSSIYLLRDKKLTRLNRHHTLGALLDEAVAGYLITPEVAKEQESERAHLTSYLGMDGEPMIEQQHTLLWRPGDTFLLASDGLTDTLSLEELEAVLRDASIGTLCRDLLDAVKKKAPLALDNTTVLAISLFIPPSGERTPSERMTPVAPLHTEPKKHTLAIILILIALALLFFVGLSLGLKIGTERGRKSHTGSAPILKKGTP